MLKITKTKNETKNCFTKIKILKNKNPFQATKQKQNGKAYAIRFVEN